MNPSHDIELLLDVLAFPDNNQIQALPLGLADSVDHVLELISMVDLQVIHRKDHIANP